ncbi:MAG: NAD-dependent protein deacetylase [Clostridia bacterium]|nr:NAD-dependent protein deacetylase [Clostridia bacterium]
MMFSKENQKGDKIQKFADYIEKSRAGVAITGAGISVGGGGMTYRQMSLSNRRAGVSPRYGDSYKSFLPTYLDNMFSYQPSLAHYALADLEAEGKLIGIITTNVDCMHTIAGSENVAEIQGSLQVNCCAKCGRHYDGYEIWRQDELPRCEACGGEILPWPLYSHIGLWEEDVRKAQSLISRADLIIVIGTNGFYGSAYWHCRKDDAVIVQINPGHTGFDSVADLNIREESDDVFKKLQEVRRENGGK